MNKKNSCKPDLFPIQFDALVKPCGDHRAKNGSMPLCVFPPFNICGTVTTLTHAQQVIDRLLQTGCLPNHILVAHRQPSPLTERCISLKEFNKSSILQQIERYRSCLQEGHFLICVFVDAGLFHPVIDVFQLEQVKYVSTNED